MAHGNPTSPSAFRLPPSDLGLQTSPFALCALPTWVANSRGTTSNGLTVADGSYLYLRRNGADAGGNDYTRDASALDNISITPVPEPAEWGMICAAGMLGFCGWHAWRERRRALREFPNAS